MRRARRSGEKEEEEGSRDTLLMAREQASAGGQRAPQTCHHFRVLLSASVPLLLTVTGAQCVSRVFILKGYRAEPLS